VKRVLLGLLVLGLLLSGIGCAKKAEKSEAPAEQEVEESEVPMEESGEEAESLE